MQTAADVRAADEGCYFDPGAAERVRVFFDKFLRHSKGRWAGKPFGLLDWQWHDVVRPLFGWKRADGKRRFRRAYIEIPKKNGKSTLCAGFGLYFLVADGEAGAEVYSAAADRDQAAIVHNEAAEMVKASPELSSHIQVVQATKRLVFPRTRSVYKALSAEAPTKEGLNIHALIFDELHAQPNRVLWDTLEYGGAAREQPMVLAITTAGWDRHSICWEVHSYARQILDGALDATEFFAYIRAADEGDEWTDPVTWRKANPSLGITIDETEFSEACEQAKAMPTKENAFKRYRLNIWTEQEVRWLPMAKWDACGGEDVDPKTLLGKPCFAGLDLSTTTDVTAFAMVFRLTDGRYAVLPHFWVPRESAQSREKKDKVPYLTWARQGFVTLTDGEVVNYDYIRAAVSGPGALEADAAERAKAAGWPAEGFAEQYMIREIAFDRFNASQLVTQLTGDGHEMVPFGQGFVSMGAPARELEKLVTAGKLVHFGNPVLRWMASNCCAEIDAAGNIKASKKKSTEKIDGIIALLMGLGRAIVSEPEKKSVYESRGVLRL